ncbi:MAG: hypothetical protein ACI86H_002856, partial [bacterium]
MLSHRQQKCFFIVLNKKLEKIKIKKDKMLSC